MKTTVKFLLMILLFGASVIMLLHIGVAAKAWYAWLVLLFLPAAGWIAGKTNFQSNE